MLFIKKKIKDEQKAKKGYAIMSIAFVLAALFLVYKQLSWPKTTVMLDGHVLHLVVADTIAHQVRGLGNRDSIEPHDGMIFPYGRAKRHAMVMRDMRFPIDIIWIANGKVVDIAPNVPLEPGRKESELTIYLPRDLATGVVELPAGWVEEKGLNIGDSFEVVKD